MHSRTRSFALVLLQVLSICVLAVTTPFMWPGLVASILIAIALFILIWAVLALRKSVLSVFPEPAEQASLITNGPYKLVRHPMYTAILVGCIGLLCTYFTWGRFYLLLLLVVVLIIKIRVEEKLLANKFDDYPEYCKRTF